MSIVFQVTDSAGQPIEYFAYGDNAARIGEPSAFGVVFRAYAADKLGNPLGNESWVIKESNSSDQSERFEREYSVMKHLAAETRRRTGTAFSPEPIYQLKRVDNELPGIAMPIYTEKIRDLLPTWTEKNIVRRMIDYLDVLIVLHENGYICLDRKVDDLRWHNNHLVVIDWNVLTVYEPSAVQAEIMQTIRVWYLLLTAYEPTARLNPYNDSEWQALGSTEPGAKISIGLRTILANALAALYNSIDDLKNALQTWHDNWLCAGSLSLDAGTIEQYADFLHVSPRKAKTALLDLSWRNFGGSESERTAALVSLLEKTDELGDLADTLERAAEAILGARYGNAYQLVASHYLQGDTQLAAVRRWQLLIDVFRNEQLDRLLREELKDKHALALMNGLKRLSRPTQDDEAAESLLPLAQVEQAFNTALQVVADARLETIRDEIRMRRRLLEAAHSQREGMLTGRYELLKTVVELAGKIDYSPLVIVLQPIQAELDEARRIEEIREGVDNRIHEMQTAGSTVFRGWKAPAALPDFRPLLHLIEQGERDLARHQAELVTFNAAANPFRRVMGFLSGVHERSLDDIVTLVKELLSLLPTNVHPTFTPVLQSIIENAAMRRATQIEEAFSKGDTSSLAIARALRLSPTVKSSGLVTQKTLDRFARVETQLRAVDEFLEFESTAPNLPTGEIVQKARELNIPLLSPIIQPYVDKALAESAENRQAIRGEFEQFKGNITKLVNQKQSEIQRENQQARDAFAAEQTRLLTEQTTSIENIQTSVIDTKKSLEESVKRLRTPLISGFVGLILLVLVAIALIFVTNNGVNQQTNELQTRIVQAELEQSATNAALEVSEITATYNAALSTLAVQLAEHAREQTATQQNENLMVTVQAMITEAVSMPTAIALLPEVTEMAPVSVVPTETPAPTEVNVTAPFEATPITETPTLESGEIDRTGETLSSARLTDEEMAQVITLANGQSGDYVLRFTLDPDGSVINFIQVTPSSELDALYTSARRVIQRARGLNQPASSFHLDIAIRSESTVFIAYPILRLVVAYAGQPANSVQLLYPDTTRDNFFRFDETFRETGEIVFLRVTADFLSVYAETVAPRENELVLALVADGRVQRVWIGEQDIAIDTSTMLISANPLPIIEVQAG